MVEGADKVQMLTRFVEWFCLPIPLRLWQGGLLWVGLFTAVMLWIDGITPIDEASYCFMDAVLWVDGLINFQHGDVVSGQVEGDRPPLSLWMGAWLYAFGYTEVQSLQMVARIAIAGLVATMGVALISWTSVLVSGLSIWMLLSSAAFGKLTLWLNAEMLINALFVIHLCVGTQVLRLFNGSDEAKPWTKRAWLLALGVSAGLAVCAKEQGVLLLPWSILGVLCLLGKESSLKLIRESASRLGWYGLGALPLLGWYGVHLYAQWVYGEKWRIFQADLLLMASRDSFAEQMTAETTWGTFAKRFGNHDSWWSFFEASSTSLMQDMVAPMLVVLSLFALTLGTMVTMVVARVQQWTWMSLNLREGLWMGVHVLAVLPLLVVPIFEPYHYTVLWAPVVMLLAWSSQQWVKAFRWMGLPVLGVFAFCVSDVSQFQRTLKLERESCISTRLIPVRTWISHKASQRAILWVTDSLTPYDRSLYPQRIKPFSTYDGRCSSKDYLAVSGLSNEAHLFAQEQELYPNAWIKDHEIPSINKEVWQIYRSDCSKR